MKRRKLTQGMQGTQRGQAMAEYTICALILILALFAPIPPESESVADKLVAAVKKNHEAKVHAIGNPVIGSSKGL